MTRREARHFWAHLIITAGIAALGLLAVEAVAMGFIIKAIES